VTIDYSDALGKADLIAFGSTPTDSVSPIMLGYTYDTGSMIGNVGGGCLSGYLGSCLGAGESYLLGTLTFHKTDGAGSFEITALLVMVWLCCLSSANRPSCLNALVGTQSARIHLRRLDGLCCLGSPRHSHCIKSYLPIIGGICARGS
jgi:hypothetical protein